jgi:hypothetical protein
MPMICKSYGRNWGLAGHNNSHALDGVISQQFHISHHWPAASDVIR